MRLESAIASGLLEYFFTFSRNLVCNLLPEEKGGRRRALQSSHYPSRGLRRPNRVSVHSGVTCHVLSAQPLPWACEAAAGVPGSPVDACLPREEQALGHQSGCLHQPHPWPHRAPETHGSENLSVLKGRCQSEGSTAHSLCRRCTAREHR